MSPVCRIFKSISYHSEMCNVTFFSQIILCVYFVNEMIFITKNCNLIQPYEFLKILDMKIWAILKISCLFFLYEKILN